MGMALNIWKVGGEFSPFHPSASHVPAEYRDGWNACYRAAVGHVGVAGVPNEVMEALAYWLPVDRPLDGLVGSQDAHVLRHRKKWDEAKAILRKYTPD